MSKIKAFLTGNTGHKIVFSLIIAALIEALIFLLSLPFVSVNILRHQSGSCFSIAFDKWDMNKVDKIVVSTENKDTVITDKDFIKKFVNDVKAPDSTDFKIMYGKCNIIFYADDVVVRNLEHSWTGEDILRGDNKYPFYALSAGDTCTFHISSEVKKELQQILKDDGNDYYKYFTFGTGDFKSIDILYILSLSFVIVAGYIFILIPVLLILLLPGAIRRRRNKTAKE